MPNDNKQNLSNSTDNQTPVNNNQAVTPVTDDMPPVVMEDTTPPMLNTTDLPIANTQTQTAPVVEEKKEESSETDSGSAAPNNDVVMAPVVTTQKKKFAGGRVIATILGLFLLVGGLGAGTYLVQKNQDIRERAGACGGGCGPGMMCAGDNDGDGTGECVPQGTTDDQIQQALNGGGGLDNLGGVDSAINTDGSYNTSTTTNSTSWNQWQENQGGATVASQNCSSIPGLEFLCGTGVAVLETYPNLPEGYTYTCNTSTGRCSVDGPGCNVIVNGVNGICGEFRIGTSTGGGGGGGGGTTPGNTAQCQNVKAYSSTWTLLTNAQLAQLKTGDSVNFCVTGSATGGSFNKARFTINSVLQAETTTVRPSSTDFCQSYVIPAGTTSFDVSAQINHVTLGWK